MRERERGEEKRRKVGNREISKGMIVMKGKGRNKLKRVRERLEISKTKD